MNIVRYFITGFLLAVTFITLAAVLPSHIDPSFLAAGQTAAPVSVITFSDVPVNQDVPFACTTSQGSTWVCVTLGKLINLKDPAVDAVLVTQHVIYYDKGIIVFDYRLPNPRG